MDESSSLLDLLECSVCLERLDTTAKVLPCQHTFCRRCLENILSSRNELRCPECRILQRPHPFPGLTSGLRCRNIIYRHTSCLPSALSFLKGQTPPPLNVSPPIRNIPALPCGKALYSYEGKEPGDLQFSKGDIIILRRKVDDNWYHGELNGCHGFLPASYIQLLRPLSQTPPQGKALYDFEVKDKDQDKDCLAFSKDSVLTVIRRVDENWAEGMLGDKIGIFPILYVELNETAKQLMEIDKPTTTSGKKNAKKRHSFTALSVTQRAAQLNNRHSMEISNPVLISSSDPRAAARIQVNTQGPDISSNGAKMRPPLAPPPPRQGYLALYAYKPQKADELELRKGEMYRVTEKCQDGWFKGTSLRTAASGVFPGNYVTPVSSPPAGSPERPTVAVSPLRPRAAPRPVSPVGPSPWCPLARVWDPRRSPPRPPDLSCPCRHRCPASRLQTSQPRSCTVNQPVRHSLKLYKLNVHLLLNPQKERKAAALLKLLSGAAAKKKPRSPPSSPPTHDTSLGASLIPSDDNANSVMLWQGRAGSCPIESDMGAIGLEPLHRKSGSLDTNFPRSLPATRTGSALMALRPEYRVVVPYPPQSEAEIELREGDVVFVHKKRDDGWYKGTLQRNGQTGLFPGSFVESF
uniref:RING-type E3 ubiquitin transferase n=1 Tax=Neogobius melanostomus TaxID=47308 RepID=A0A8C6SES5_9GOBI